jgi:integrase
MPRRKTRRSKGEGTPWFDEKTGQHRWRIRKNGKNYTVSDKDPERAAAKFRELKRDLEDDRKVDEGKQTLDTFTRRYLDTALRVGESTALDYAKRAGYYILPTLGHYALDKLTTELGELWVAAMVRRGWSVNSIKQALRLAQRILDRAVAEHLIKYNPFAVIKPPRVEQDESDDDEEGTRALAPAQVDVLLADVKAHDQHHSSTAGKDGRRVRSAGMYLLYMLALLLGLRRGELLGLRRRDIDLDERVLRVRQQVIRLDNEYRISRKLKTPAARRELPLSDVLVALLRLHILRIGAVGDDLLFPGKDGGALRPDAVTKHFARACKRVGIQGFHFHDLRHTFVTNLRTAGIEPEVAAAMAGHEKPDVTLTVYSSVDMARKRAAMERAG